MLPKHVTTVVIVAMGVGEMEGFKEQTSGENTELLLLSHGVGRRAQSESILCISFCVKGDGLLM